MTTRDIQAHLNEIYGVDVSPELRSEVTDAVRAVYPQTKVLLCIVHMVRNSTKYVSYKDLKAVCHVLKQIYTAVNEEEALEALEDFGKNWDNKYPMIQRSWEANWDDLNEFFAYPEEIRRVIYT